MAVLPQEPLINLHLSLVPQVPVLIERFYLFILAGCFVVNDNKLAFFVDPHVIERPRYCKARRRVLALNTFKILPPRIDVFVYKGDRVNAVLLHQGVGCRTCAVHIKFFFKQRVYRTVEVKRKTWRARDPQFVVNVKTAGAFQKERDF
ncbi:hypothetical protein A2943_01565 [Candidatus Adlerbacteria bacterium RIFCSPLOWO2_01_FULL_51_16]|uniref:Uncharacterized protein n=1 Tax=Candidatus Adlerbacteria bacterium RIFCSPLOWO2_01_FULL_51_16 TaxID=1797243 RepID=A0A1F4XEG1_9BACT|nr:MAG: hypothetical protein A2943_01565 [Candidatus Adlerbacteria bacterium RIFCSPLOWO2_01_FULL_51_16]